MSSDDDVIFSLRDDWGEDQKTVRNPRPLGFTLGINEMADSVHCWDAHIWETGEQRSVHRYLADHTISKRGNHVNDYYNRVNL